MFEVITKKEFLETLEKGYNKQLYCNFNMDAESEILTKIMQSAYNFNEDIKIENLRSCIKKQTNALQFLGGSWLYFNSLKGSKFYKHNNVYVSYIERYDSFDEKFVVDIMIYYIKKM